MKVAYILLAIGLCALFFFAGYAQSVPHCREVVIRDIAESNKYQVILDQMLRPDWVSELEKAKK